jgi:aspartate/methionine/tyrosine aminotransferase
MIRRAGGTPVSVMLRPPDWRYVRAEIEAAITPRTRMLVLNDPHNPTGKAASAGELAMLAELCVEHDLIALCDDVWEEVRFDGLRHRSLMAEPGMAGRAVKIGSAGKLFGLTGWKTGWLCAAPDLAPALARVHQFLTFTTPPALQWAVAEGLALPDDWYEARDAEWAALRDRLQRGLERGGYVVLPSAATWFLCVDLAASGIALSDAEFAERAVREASVASIPISALGEGAVPTHIVRFCFTKPEAVLDEAAERLAAFRAKLIA